MKLTEQQKEFFASMESTLDSSGWALMENGWRDEQERLESRVFFGAKDMNDVLEARVRYGLLKELLDMPEMIREQKETILNTEVDPEEVVTGGRRTYV